MKKSRSVLVAAVALLAVTGVGCYSSRYEPEPVAPAKAPAASAAPAADSQGGIVVPGLVEWGRSWYGARNSRGEGQVTLGADFIDWRNQQDSERSFTLKLPVIKAVWLTCAARPGDNLCLDLGVITFTDLEYHFRDRNWAGGDNASILRIYSYLKANFPQVTFEEKVVKTVD